MILVTNSEIPVKDLSRWIRGKRPVVARPTDVFRPHSTLHEFEPDGKGGCLRTWVVFLINRECPWTCFECDLWKYTVPTKIPPGAIVAQIDEALRQAQGMELDQIKFYNSGSFFDVGAVPPELDGVIATKLHRFKRVIVESHPALIGTRCWKLQEALTGELEVAMGLETAHEPTLKRLNKRMTLADFERAAAALRQRSVALRCFVLIKPPFMLAKDVVEQTVRSVKFAQQVGASVISLIATRSGNGAVDILMKEGEFTLPNIKLVESAFEAAIEFATADFRVLLDSWDLDRLIGCDTCKSARISRMMMMNQTSKLLAQIECELCRS